jgi:subfamily B ATP-binding cassette protein MsbA
MTNLDILKRLYNNYTKQFLKKILLSVFFSVLVAGSTSAIAYLLDPAIKKIFVEKDQTLILLIPLCIFAAFSIKGISLYIAKVTMIRVAEEVKKIIQVDMLKSLIKADTQVIDNKHTGKFITHITFDVGMITNLVSTVLLNFFKDSLTLIGLLTVMFYQNWKLSLIAIIMIPLASLAAKSLGRRIGKVSTETMATGGIVTTYLMEIFKNHKLIKIFQKEEYEAKRGEGYLNKLKEKSQKVAEVFVRASPVMETLTGLMIGGLIYYSGKLIILGEISINNFFSFLAAMMLAYQPVRSLATLNMAIHSGLASAKRILPVIDTQSSIIEKRDASELLMHKGDIEFKNVNFKYIDNKEKDDEKEINLDEKIDQTKIKHVLKVVNLSIKGNKMTSIVGHSGAGKSTILNLIPRFYEIDSGEISIDGQLIKDITIASLRKNISMVTQDITLFDDTIKNNIKYANLEASDEEILNASKLSFADEFIKELPNQYETEIGENGVRLSGGEKQRLSIARALLKKSPIILLDEATSSLDAETENKIQEAVNYLTKNRTTIVIAHRLSTILNSDNIYVIDGGKVVGEGKHEDLLKNSEIYKNFYNKQIRKA